MTTTPTKKSTRHRGLHLSRTKRKALRRRSQYALRYWKFLTRCFTSLRRRPAFRFSNALKRWRAALGALALACWLPALAQADTFTVNSNSDISEEEDGDLTLREAITRANENPGPDTIDFTDDLSGAVIKLTQGELAISDELSIDASSLAEAPIIDADQKSRVMHFTASEGSLDLTRLTLRNGTTDGDGAGILFTSTGALTLTNATTSGNKANGEASEGGGISALSGAVILVNSVVSGNDAYSGGGIATKSGSITLANSTVTGNHSGYGHTYGGGLYSDSGTITLADSSVSQNQSGYGGGICTVSGAVILTNSTLNGNEATYGVGGGISTRSGAIALTNSTLNGNRSSWRGAGIDTDSGALSLVNSTITGNITGSPFTGDYGAVFSSEGAISIVNSIIAGNWERIYSVRRTWDGGFPKIQIIQTSRNPSDLVVSGNFAEGLQVSHSLIGKIKGARLDEALLNKDNLIAVDPLLAPLADNGGPTQTMLPYPESPVINAGAPTGHPTDQRGLPHLGAPDIGAVEFQGTSDLRRVLPLDHDGDGNSYQLEKAVGTNPFVSDSNDPRLLQRPTFKVEGQAVLSFGIAETALAGTRWILERTTDLENYEVIYHFGDNEHSEYEDHPITITETETGVSITDEAPPSGPFFYRLRIILEE